MSIGQMRERAKIYEVTAVPDGIGGMTTTRVFVKDVWVKVQQQPWAKTEGQHFIPIQLQMRTGTYALTTKNIVGYEGVDYTITSITTDPLKRLTTALMVANGS